MLLASPARACVGDAGVGNSEGHIGAGHPSLEGAMKQGRLISVISALLFVAVSAGAAGAQQKTAAAPAKSPAPPAPGPAISAEQYKIGPEDLVAVSVWKNDAM